MSVRLFAMLVGVAMLAALAGGCGGGDDSEEQPLTKAQYIKKGNKICAKEGERLGKEMVAYGEQKDPEGSGEPNTQEDTALTISVILIPGFRAEVEALEELMPPAEDEARVEAMLERFNAGLEDGEENPNAFFTKSEFQKGTAAAKKYGLESCGILFLSR
jgi:hypothetical protein